MRARPRSRTLASVVPGLLVALGLSLLVPVAATTPARAASQGAPTVVEASSIGRPAASEARKRLTVVSHNVEKRPGALGRALAAARRSDAQVIALQEVCGWQADDLRRSNPGWTVNYRAEHDHDKCLRSATRAGSTSEGRQKIGTVVIWTGGPTARSTQHTFRHQRSSSHNAGLTCVRWAQGSAYRACSVHLVAPSDAGKIKVRTNQARDIRSLARRWIARDEMVVLAGDFNAEPRRRTMDYLYDQGGEGDFREASGHPSRLSRCTCHEVTLAGRDVKIDYIFYSSNRLPPRAHRSLRTADTASDHHLLIGRADVDAS